MGLRGLEPPTHGLGNRRGTEVSPQADLVLLHMLKTLIVIGFLFAYVWSIKWLVRLIDGAIKNKALLLSDNKTLTLDT